jgi:hypothetical protein
VNHYQGKKTVAPTLSDHQPKERACLGLGCSARFWSLGPANRFCPTCKPAVEKKRASSSKQQLERVRDMGLGK